MFAQYNYIGGGLRGSQPFDSGGGGHFSGTALFSDRGTARFRGAGGEGAGEGGAQKCGRQAAAHVRSEERRVGKEC